MLAILLLCVIGTVILALPGVQTKLARMATNRINTDFGTNINIERLRVSLISWDTSLRGVYIEDYKKDTLAYIDELTTSILSFKNMANNRLEFGDVEIEELYLNLKTYEGADDTNLGIFIEKLDDNKPRPPGTPPFYLGTDEIEINNSTFKLSDENLEKEKVLHFTDLNILGEDFTIVGPEVTVDIKSLSLDSGIGLQLEKLATEFRYSTQQMRFDSLRIATPKSALQGSLIFDYDRKDMGDFTNKVNLSANFAESTVAFDEINLLYDQFGKGKTVEFSGDFSGVLNDLNLENLFLVSDNTGIRGDFNFKNLFTKKEPFSLNGDVRNITTSYYQLRALLPNILGESLPSTFQKLGQFTLRGTTYITETTIESKLNLNSAIGSTYADLTLTDIDNIDNASYKGFVSLIDFNLGEFVSNKRLGKATLDVNVEGKGFVSESLNTEVIGDVYAINYNQYEYNNINVSGVLKNQLYDGNLVCNDDNIKCNFQGLADFGNGLNTFNFQASVDYADFQKLNFINDSISIFKGDVNMNIQGNSLQNIVGDINFRETSYQNINNTYYFDDFQITSTFSDDSVRTVTINSPDIIEGYMSGKFQVRELDKLVQNSIGSIYTNYRPYEISPGQELTFNFKIYNKIVEVFFPEVEFGPNTFIRGNIEADESDFKLNFKSPMIAAFGNSLENIDVKIDNKNPLFNTFVSVEDVNTIYYDVKDFNLINTTLKDTLFFRTEFKGGSDYDDTYNLNFYHTFNEENKSVIGLKRSDVSFKGYTWILNQENNRRNKVIVNSTLDSIQIDEIVMNNNNEEQIRLRGQLADSTYKDIELQFKIVSLNKIAPEIDSLQLKGIINGTLNIRQKDEVYLPICNLDISDFGINKVELGQLNIGIVGNKNLSEFVVNSQITDEGIERFGLFGKIFNPNEGQPTASLRANFSDFDLSPFSPLGDGVIDQIRGFVSGNAEISGTFVDPEINGSLTLNNAGIAIPYLNVNYDFEQNAKVNLIGQLFDFQNIKLTDVAESTSATLDGTIGHNSWKDWRLDLDVVTEGDRFLILNTDYEEDVLYYGTGFANGTGRIYGPTNALTITFDGATARGTSLKIPLSDVATVGDYSFINFIEKDKVEEIEVQRTLRDYEGLEMEFDLVVTPEAEVEIIVDPKTGSTLKGTGEGILLIEINTNGKFNMFGDFVVVTGEYNYRFGGVIDKTFSVRPGGTIVWEGDPLAARLNMEAVYSLNANPAPLLDNAAYTRRIPTDVVVRLTEELESPTIDFDIEFPGTSSIVKSELEYRLQDPTVEERNAFFLLAQGTFANEATSINQQAVTGNLIQTASGLLNQVLGGSNDKFDFGVSYEQGYLDPNDVLTENRIGVTVSTQISDRVLFNGRFGVPVGGVSETVVAGDVEVQVLLNEEGTLRAKIFNRENEIRQFLGDQQGYTQGVGLSYEVDFNSFSELMRKLFGKGQEIEEEPVEEDIQSSSYMGPDSLIRFIPKTRVPDSKRSQF